MGAKTVYANVNVCVCLFVSDELMRVIFVV